MTAARSRFANFAMSRRSTRELTRSERLALAPRPPNRAIARYLRLVAAWRAEAERLVAQILLPELPGGERRDAFDDLDQRFLELNAALDALGDRLSQGLHEVGRDVAAHAEQQVAKSLALDVRLQADLDEPARRFVARNVSLIKSVGREQLGRMRELVDAYHAGQFSQDALRVQIQNVFGLTRARAALIARDQTLKANADITRERQTANGVTEYIWTTARDERVRGRPGGKWGPKPGRAYNGGDHWSLDGQRFRWDQPPIVDPRTGRRAHPGQDFQCRCVAVPVLDTLLGSGVVLPTPAADDRPVAPLLVSPAPRARPRRRR